MKKAIILIVGLVVIVGAAAYLHKENFFSKGADTFPKIGVVLPTEGSGVVYGVETGRAIKLALEEFDVSKSKMKILDGMCDRETAKKAAQKLIKSGYKFIIGEACSGGTLGIAELPEVISGEVIVITTSASSTLLADHPNVLRTNVSDKLNIEVLADAIKNNGHSSVAIISDSREYAQSFSSNLEKVLTPKGIGSENFIFESSSSSINAAVEKANRYTDVIGADAFVIIPQSAIEAIDVFKSIRKVSDFQIYDAFVTAANPETIVDDLGDDAEGIISVSSSNIDKNSPRFRAFKAKYTKKYGAPLYDSYLLATYDAISFLYFITKVTGKENPRAFADVLRGNLFKSEIDFTLSNGNPIHREITGYDFDLSGDSVSEHSLPVIKIIKNKVLSDL